MTPEEIEGYNGMIRSWSAMVRRKIIHRTLILTHGKSSSVTRGIASGHPRTEHKLQSKILYKPRYFYGEIDSISYSFERHGVFVHKGVGRGYIMQGNTVIRGIKATPAAKKAAILAGLPVSNTILSGPIRRKPVNWFNIIIDQNVPELADKIAQANLNAAVNALRLRIV